MQYYTLHNDIQIPALGFGTWKLKDGQEAYDAVSFALKEGYTHIDTAQIYGNEASVGRAIKDSCMAREEVFLTTKIWNTHHNYDEAMASFEESLEKLQTEYVDLLLIHWPNPIGVRENDGYIERNRQVWQAMEDLYKEGRVKAIGVSNFREHHLTSLMEVANITPMVNQIKLAPGLTEEKLVAFCRQHDIIPEAYSPLGHGSIFEHEGIQALADKYNTTSAQLALAWSLAKGFLPLPKSATPKNIQSNLDIFEIQLTAEDIELLDKMTGIAEVSDPDTTDF